MTCPSLTSGHAERETIRYSFGMNYHTWNYVILWDEVYKLDPKAKKQRE